MKYLIKRTEVFESDAIIGYLQESGTFGNKRTARVFADRGKAEDYIDTERCDPIYDKAFMGGLAGVHPNDNTATVWLKTAFWSRSSISRAAARPRKIII